MKIKHDEQGPRTVHECEDCKPLPFDKMISPYMLTTIEINELENAMMNFGTEMATQKYVLRAVKAHNDLLRIVKQMVFNHDHGDNFQECDWKYIQNSIDRAEGH